MTRRVFIVHGWGGSPETNWLSWLKSELGSRGLDVHVPAMPNTDTPVIEEWVSHLSKVVGTSDKDTYFIGASIGCQTIMRYLERINAKVGGVLFVAGWINLNGLETDEEREIASPWLSTPINFEKVRKATAKLTALFSTDDPFVPLSDKNIFKKNLGAKIVIEKNVGHFDGGRYEIILNEFLNLVNQ